MAEETLKSYLIGIGFKIDQMAQQQAEEAVKRAEERATDRVEQEAERRAKLEKKEAVDQEKRRALEIKRDKDKFAESLNNFRSFSTKFLGIQAALGAITGLTAAGIVSAVDKAAKSYEQLHYLGKRNGTSPRNAKAFGYAASQLGSSVEEANAGLNAFGSKLRNNGTGYAEQVDAVLKRIGKSSRDAKGNLRDTAEVATDLGDAFRDMAEKEGYGKAKGWAASLGIEENLMRATMERSFRSREGQYLDDHTTLGADDDKAAESATAFEQSMRHLQEVLEALGTRLSTSLMPKLQPLLDGLSAWFLKHGDQIAPILQRVADDLIALAAAIGEKLAGANWDEALDNVESLAKSFGELLSKLDGPTGIVALLGLMVARLTLMKLMPIWLQALLLGSIATDLAVPNDKKPGIMTRSDEEAGGLPGNETSASDQWGVIKKGWGWLKNKVGLGDGKPAAQRGDVKPGGWWTPDRQKHAYDYFKSQGYTDAGAAAATARMAYVESIKDGPNSMNGSGHHGIFQASRTRSAKYGNSTDFDTQLKAYVEQADGPDGQGSGAILRRSTNDAEAARGAAVMERAEGWNGYTDMWAGKTLRNMDNVRRNAAPPPPPDPIPPKMPDAGPKSDKVSLGPSPVQRMILANSARSRLQVAHTPTFNIDGGAEHRTEMADIAAGRGARDLLRNVQGAEA